VSTDQPSPAAYGRLPSEANPSDDAPRDYQALDDGARLQEIADLGLNGSGIDRILSEIAAEAARHFGLPVALVSIVLDRAQHFRGSHGLDGWMATTGGTPAEWSFCQHVVRNSQPFVVEDAQNHPLMQDSPLVGIEGVRCYAGVPLVTFRGHVIGSFCVQGPEARSFTKYDLAQLQRYAKRAITRIEQRRQR
jgi:GAF domain-containing protein